ncbi:hypothetical protein ACWNT8_12155 [Pigmentibacter ruber]|nr:hypothetical protein GTC16762_15630 [Pigmentibacter ruber]
MLNGLLSKSIQTQIDIINYEELKIKNLKELSENKKISLLKRNFELQLRIGIRYFNIRIDFPTNVEPTLTHGGFDLFIKLTEVIQIFKEFLNEFISLKSIIL